jgi:hypothetical protein
MNKPKLCTPSVNQLWVRRLAKYKLLQTWFRKSFPFQVPTSDKLGLQVCFKEKLNTKTDSMWKKFIGVHLLYSSNY